MKTNIERFICKVNELRDILFPVCRRIWKEYGYYISLACLITLFGVTAYVYRTTDRNEAIAVSADNSEYAAAISMLTATPAPTAEPEPYEPDLLMPVNGSSVTEWAPDELVWNESLGQWTVHCGIDFAAAAGTVVTAAEDGVVSAAYEDDMYGFTIELSHGEGWVTRYCSLETLQLVQTGMQVNKGDTISAVGTSALAECASGPHLHFELLNDGEQMRPEFE